MAVLTKPQIYLIDFLPSTKRRLDFTAVVRLFIPTVVEVYVVLGKWQDSNGERCAGPGPAMRDPLVSSLFLSEVRIRKIFKS
jgi:hypothetical protein